MKKVYLDKTTVTTPLGVWMKNTEIINAGTTIYSMPVKNKNSEYQRYADEYEFLSIEDIPKRKQNMLQAAKTLDIVSWLPAEQVSLEELEQIFLNHKMGIKNDEYIVSMELPENVDVNISDCWKELNTDGKMVACISKENDVVALISYRE